MNIYLAGPLFSIAERDFNLMLAETIKGKVDDITIILPQLEAKEISGSEIFAKVMFTYCLSKIEDCDCLIAILEGSDADSGTCIEMGYAYSKKIPIIGIRTDARESEDRGLNLMVSNVCYKLINDASMSVETIAVLISEELKLMKKNFR